jgi:hypothetical protein
MTLRRAVFAALLLGAAATAGLPAQAAFYPRSPQVTDLERLFRLAGRAFPVAGFPVSEQSLADWAAALAEDAPQSAGAVERYLEGLAFQPGQMEIAIRSRFSLEGYLRTGAVWEDFTHEYLDREPLGELTLSMSLEGRAAVVVQAFLHREYFGLSDWNLPGSEAGNPLALENRHVTKGYLWYNFDPLQVEFGRDVVHFGPLRSSLLPSDRLPFMDLLRLTLPLGRLTMDLMISSLESIKTTDDTIGLTGDFAFEKNVILANLHRFEYDFGFLRAAASALVVLAREDNFFVLADFFPVFSWHDADIKPNNMSLIFDLDAVLFPGFRVMGQFGFDDIKATIAGGADSEIPTIFAGIVGVEYSRPLSFAGLDLYAEAGYTHYLWGSFHEKWYLEKAIYRLELDGEAHALPLTSPYGPGTVWVNAEAGLEDWAGFTARLSGELVFRNPTVINLFTTVYESDPAVAGAALEGTLAVKGELRYQWKWLEAYAKPAFFTRASGGWLELALGATANLDWRRAVGKAAK